MPLRIRFKEEDKRFEDFQKLEGHFLIAGKVKLVYEDI